MQLDVQAIWDELDAAESQVSARRIDQAPTAHLTAQRICSAGDRATQAAKHLDEGGQGVGREPSGAQEVRTREHCRDERRREWSEQRSQLVGQNRRGGAV